MLASLPLLLVLAVSSALAGDKPAAAPIPKDAIGRPYYDCVHAAAFASRMSAEVAVAKAHEGCRNEAVGMEVKLLMEFQGVFDALGPSLAEPQKAQLKENVEQMVKDIDGSVLDELRLAPPAEKA